MRQTVLHIIIYTAVLLPLSASGQKDDGMHRYNTHELTIGKTNFVDTIPIVFAATRFTSQYTSTDSAISSTSTPVPHRVSPT